VSDDQFRVEAKVRCFPSEDCLIAESADKRWLCLVPAANVKSKMAVIGSLNAVSIYIERRLTIDALTPPPPTTRKN
jgi:hypothetical protein